MAIICYRSWVLGLMSFLLLSPSLAQTKFALSGTIEVNNGEVFPYKLVFTESNGTIRGYSLTYQEPEETKASITGTLDRSNRVLTFRETDIEYSHGYHTKAFMCLIDAHTIYVQTAAGKALKGPIQNTDASNTACTGGNVTFADKGELNNLFNPQQPFDTVITMKKRTKEVTALKDAAEIKEPIVTDKITKGVEKIYEWHSDTVVIDVWDGGSVDGDKVTLQYNGVSYLTSYFLQKQKKRLHIPVSNSGTDVITIMAENEGTEPPNTASLMLIDGNTPYSILAYNPKGQASVIKIKRMQ